MFAALDAFVNNGGNVLAFNTASNAMIDGLKLPVKNVLAGVRNTDFYAPGSILGVEIKRDHPIARGFTATVPAVWFENGPAFEISDPSHGDGGGDLSGDRQSAALRLAARWHEAQWQSGARRREARARARGALRIPAAVPRAVDGDIPAHLGRDSVGWVMGRCGSGKREAGSGTLAAGSRKRHR